MAKDITKELLETIKQTLPETQVGLVKDALNERDELKEENKDLAAQVKEARQEVTDLRKMLEDADHENVELEKAAEFMKSKVASVEAINADLEKKDVERRAAEAEAELRGIKTTVDQFLRNTIVRETNQHHVANSYGGSQVQYVNGQQVAVPTSSTTNVPVTDVKDREAVAVSGLAQDAQ